VAQWPQVYDAELVTIDLIVGTPVEPDAFEGCDLLVCVLHGSYWESVMRCLNDYFGPAHRMGGRVRSANASMCGTAKGKVIGSQFLLKIASVTLMAISTIQGGALFGAPPEVPPQTKIIDDLIQQGWIDYEVRPSSEIGDAKWCRRVYLDILGRIPSLEELEAYVSDRGAGKQQRLVESLLYDEKYTEEYAGNWASVWTNVLIGRGGGNDRRDLTSREGMQKYLRDSFAANKAYNRMVYELVTAKGTTKPGTENFNGAVNYLIGKVNADNAVLATSSTSRIFLGLQVQCTQCHDHPFNQWKQQKFWEFNSFFRQSVGLRRFVSGTMDIDHAELADQDFAGEAGDADDAVVFYEIRNGLTMAAYPVFMDAEPTDRRGRVSDVNRRDELGRLMMDSPYLDKMIVNRMWAHFMGYGFTKPVDDLGPHKTPSHPELLETLGQQFREHSYDLKQLITWITLSRPYRLSSAMTSYNQLDDPSLGESPKFSHFYLRQMQAENLYQSLIVAANAQVRGSYEKQEQEKGEWLRQFVVAFGTDEGDEATTFNGSIPQALMMFNGSLVKRATSSDPETLIGSLTRSNLKIQDQVHRLYLAGLARRASRDELTLAANLLRARNGNQAEALQDLWWAILNSNEFILQH
jgi:hypothetical protein